MATREPAIPDARAPMQLACVGPLNLAFWDGSRTSRGTRAAALRSPRATQVPDPPRHGPVGPSAAWGDLGARAAEVRRRRRARRGSGRRRVHTRDTQGKAAERRRQLAGLGGCDQIEVRSDAKPRPASGFRTRTTPSQDNIARCHRTTPSRRSPRASPSDIRSPRRRASPSRMAGLARRPGP